MKIKKIRHARPFFVQGNRDFSSGRPHKKLLTITSIEIFKKSAKRDHFSLKKIAIFHHIAPIKNLLTITSIENFQKIRQARPFFLRGNRDFSSGRPHEKFINHNFYWKFQKSVMRGHFSYEKIAIFHQVAPIKKLLTITSIENLKNPRSATIFHSRKSRFFITSPPSQIY